MREPQKKHQLYIVFTAFVRLASVSTVKVSDCFTAPVLPSGNTLLRSRFQSHLSKLMNNNCCCKSDYVKTSAARKALVCRQQAIANSAVAPRPVEQRILALPPVTEARPKALQSVAIVSSRQARVPTQQSQGRLVYGAVAKNQILTSYQEDFGNGSPITTTVLGTSSFHPLQPPSQGELVKSCRMKPESNKY